jgi:Reverse transcriptase (RNA-dependent DNA polymerase)
LPSRFAAALIAFVVHTANMVPKVNAVGHLPALTAFTGRVPSFIRDAPYQFGQAGFLQRVKGPTSNSASPRGDYCLWLGTTRNIAGTHRCLNLDTLQEITGDTFRPTLLTNEAIARLTRLAGDPTYDVASSIPSEPLLEPAPAWYSLDPNRGVEMQVHPDQGVESTDRLDIVPANDVSDQAVVEEEALPEEEQALPEEEQALPENRATDQASELIQLRNSINSGYNLAQPVEQQEIFAAMSTQEARRLYGEKLVDDASIEELNNCMHKGAWECLPPSHKGKFIPSKMFLTPKKLPSGELDKIKGRIVGGGHRQDRSLYQDSEISSPTVALTSILSMAALAAHEGHHVMTLDHKAAYLNAHMKGPPVEMLLTSEVATLLCRIDNKHEQYLRPDGKIAVRLKKALYGCVQSAVLWYEELASTLQAIGFTKNPYDVCSFNRVHEDTVDRVLVYVDDLFITSRSEKVLVNISDTLRTKYEAVTTRLGVQHNFLGIQWDFEVPGEVKLSMKGYVSDIITKYNVKSKCHTPATDNLFVSDPKSPLLSWEKKEAYHSCVMTLYYLAKRMRFDILTSVSFCTSQVLHPTQEDQKKLDRILSFLLYTQDQCLVLRIGDKIQLRAYVDSSFGIYRDAKSVTGVVIMLGNAPIYVKSGRQKIVTRSSTEAELVGISDSLSQILWSREFLCHQLLNIGPAILYQDNKSTIYLSEKGRSTSERTRHIKIRYFFVNHYIDTKEIKLEYMPTSDMIADILTKPLHGSLFTRLAHLLTGNLRSPSK